MTNPFIMPMKLRDLIEILGDEVDLAAEARQRQTEIENQEELKALNAARLAKMRTALQGIGYQTIIEEGAVYVCVDDNVRCHATGVKLLFPDHQITILDEWNIEIR